MLNFERIKWAVRRFKLPVEKNALVLEVGSGGNPYPRANVLLDAYEDTRERHWAPLIQDRPTVLAFGECLPFKDKAFDFVVAAHVLEHTSHPDKFLSELQRVACAGYIETPDAFMERINPYKDHRLEVTVRNGTLIIRKKPAWIVDSELVNLYEHQAKTCVTRELIPNHPRDFHVRYYWKDTIDYRILNPDVDAAWEPDVTGRPDKHGLGLKGRIRDFLLKTIRCTMSQNRRNKAIDLLPLLRCIQCGTDQCVRRGGIIKCENCDLSYLEEKNILYVQQKQMCTA